MKVLGVDPGFSPGKPIGLAVVAFLPDGSMEILYLSRGERMPRAGDLEQQIAFRDLLVSAIDQWSPDLVAIENARGKGQAAGKLQIIVRMSKQAAKDAKTPSVLIHPMQVKSAIAMFGSTPMSKEQVVEHINNLFGESLGDAISNDENDLADAIAIAIAGEAHYKVEQI